MTMNDFTWNEEFASRIDESKISDGWDLCIDINLGKQDKGLKYSQYTFGSFRCSRCSRSWSSSKVFVLFVLNKRQKHGTARMRIFKQNCERCKHSAVETPKIPPENIARVVYNLVHKIQIAFYGLNDQKEDLKPKTYGPSDGPHNREFCEACRHGLCEREMQSGEENGEISIPGVLSSIVLGVGAVALMYLSTK